MSCGVGRRGGSDLVLLWLWRRPAATAPIRPLAWEPPYATGAAPQRQKAKTNKQTKKKPPRLQTKPQNYSNQNSLAITQKQIHRSVE